MQFYATFIILSAFNGCSIRQIDVTRPNFFKDLEKTTPPQCITLQSEVLGIRHEAYWTWYNGSLEHK